MDNPVGISMGMVGAVLLVGYILYHLFVVRPTEEAERRLSVAMWENSNDGDSDV
jgi:hypothetical protein